MNDLIAVSKVKEDEEKIMKDIIASKGSNLPANIEQITAIFEFTDFKAKAWKILAGKISKLEDQADLYQSAIRSGQQWGIAALYAQKRMGEITREMPTKNRSIPASERSDASKKETLKTQGISRGTYFESEQMAAHPEILDRVIESAKKRGEIPTKTAVLNTIRVERQKEIDQKAREKGEKRIVNATTTATKDYYDLIKGFESGIKNAIINAEAGKFAPEGKNFMIKKHNHIRTLLKKLEDIL